MNILQRYSLFSFILLCMMASCSSDAPDPALPSDGGVEMVFSVGEATRADQSDNQKFNRFIVFGDIRRSTTSGSVKLLDNLGVNYKETSDTWEAEERHFWIPGYEHSFVAITPEQVLQGSADAQYADSKLSFTYKLPITDGKLDKENVQDMLVATHRRQYEKSPDGTINLKFAHLMSMVNFTPAFYNNLLSDDSYIEIDRMEISGVSNGTRFYITPAPRLTNSQTDDMEINVSTQGNGNAIIELESPIRLYNNGPSAGIFAADNALILCPQSFNADSGAKIVFYYRINDDPAIKEASLSLDNQNWGSGNSYNYKFTIEKIGIILDKCEINPWKEIKGDEVSVD